MSWALLVPEVLGEARHLFAAPNSCPWGAIGLLVVSSCFVGCCAGALLTLVVVSNQCRRLSLLVVRFLLAGISPGEQPVDLRGRLSQYNRHS